jgi:hypothetical protein
LDGNDKNPIQCLVWGPPLTAEDFLNGAKVNDVSITEETRKAIRTGIESETYNKGRVLQYRSLSMSGQKLS